MRDKTLSTEEFDEKKNEAFADRMINILNSGALSLMISIGHRSGLFDAMRALPPSTSKRIADSTGLQERYVHEWLGALVTGGIISCDPGKHLFSLPPEHASWLTRQSKANNLALFAQYIPLLGAIEDKIIDCFNNGGGVPYSEYKRFHEVKAEDCIQMVVPVIIDKVLPVIPGLIDSLHRGIDVLDVGCGSGQIINSMAKFFPKSRFVGYDLSEEAIATGNDEAVKQSLSNVRFEVRDLTKFGLGENYDLITAFDAIHDQPDPENILKEIARILRSEGTFLMQEIAASSDICNNTNHFIGPLLYTISCLHCMTVSLSQDGAGLGLMWGEEKTLEMLQKVGFDNVRIEKLPHDFQYAYYIMSKTCLKKI
ncbi:MAG: class I SAM-dependent methyltransferase [Candidatus Latescibacteria bacterium]|nr:class I SAM-dependent methyltransferase [Candidatus Latescibacterota bacterium]